jgi:hypothetical protein
MSGFFKSLNTHLAAIGGVLLSAAGLIVTIAPAIQPIAGSHAGQIGIAANILGLALAYFGRPVTIAKGP